MRTGPVGYTVSSPDGHERPPHGDSGPGGRADGRTGRRPGAVPDIGTGGARGGAGHRAVPGRCRTSGGTGPGGARQRSGLRGRPAPRAVPDSRYVWAVPGRCRTLTTLTTPEA